MLRFHNSILISDEEVGELPQSSNVHIFFSFSLPISFSVTHRQFCVSFLSLYSTPNPFFLKAQSEKLKYIYGLVDTRTVLSISTFVCSVAFEVGYILPSGGDITRMHVLFPFLSSVVLSFLFHFAPTFCFFCLVFILFPFSFGFFFLKIYQENVVNGEYFPCVRKLSRRVLW